MEEKERGSVNSAPGQNMQTREWSLSHAVQCQKSGLSVMQYEVVGVQMLPVQVRETKVKLSRDLNKSQASATTSVTSVKEQEYRPYSTTQTAFLIHMPVLHTTCYRLE